MNSRSSVCPAYGYRRVRYLGLARDDVQLQAMCAAINLRRAIALGLAWGSLSSAEQEGQQGVPKMS
jgi:hypothetical protein